MIFDDSTTENKYLFCGSAETCGRADPDLRMCLQSRAELNHLQWTNRPFESWYFGIWNEDPVQCFWEFSGAVQVKKTPVMKASDAETNLKEAQPRSRAGPAEFLPTKRTLDLKDFVFAMHFVTSFYQCFYFHFGSRLEAMSFSDNTLSNQTDALSKLRPCRIGMNHP